MSNSFFLARYGSPEDLEKLLNSKSAALRYNAITSNPYVNENHLNQALNDSNSMVRWAAIQNKKANEDHLLKALDEKNGDILLSAINHPNVTTAVIRKASECGNPYIQREARAHPLYRKAILELNESIDQPLSMTDLPHDSMLHQMGEFSAGLVGGKNFNMKKIANNLGYLIQYDKDGMTEVHHVDDNLQGGFKNDIPKHSGLKFVSTISHHIKNLLDDGRKVKIVAHHNLANNFRRLTDRLVAKNPGYSVSDSSHETHEITGDPMISWKLSKNNE